MQDEARVRTAAFAFLEEQSALYGDVLPRSILLAGFTFEGRRVPLVGPQGIFKPALLESMPLSITTAPIIEGRERPYDDEIRDDGLIRYRYRGTDPGHRENVGLRRAMQTQTPLIYFHGTVPGQYVPVWPVFVVEDDPAMLTFTVAVDERHVLSDTRRDETLDSLRRAYVTRATRIRLHQADFRQRVIRAYQETCAVCSLKHRELLDAAHILPDTDPRGTPTVDNGMALCKLHHAAFDQNIIGVRPDLVIEVSLKVLTEIDGPMLVHGLQGFHGASFRAPRAVRLRPNPDFLAERYDIFRRAG